MSITWPRDTTRPFVRGPRRIATEIVGALRARKLIALRQKTERLKDRAIEEAIMLSIQYIRDCGDGDLAEFGVHNGRYATIACRELNLYSQRRNVHLFDSFKGYPPLETADRSAAQIVAGTFRPGPHHGQVSPDVLGRRLRGIYRGGDIKIYEGYFDDTLSSIPSTTRFSMIVVDGCLYSSIHSVLDYVFSHSHIGEGAILLFPGWNLGRASPDQMSRRAWSDAVAKFQIEFSDEGSYCGKGRRFIVHRYGASCL